MDRHTKTDTHREKDSNVTDSNYCITYTDRPSSTVGDLSTDTWGDTYRQTDTNTDRWTHRQRLTVLSSVTTSLTATFSYICS